MHHIDLIDKTTNKRIIHDYADDIDWILTAMLETASDWGFDPDEIEILIDGQ